MSSRALVLGLCVSNAALLVAVLVLSTERGRKRLAALIPKTRRDSEDAALGTLLGKDYKPPLPHPIPEVLDRACLAYLATSSEASPHLSLMRFSYSKSLVDPDGEVVIMSTQRNTKKYAMLKQNDSVALLVHDFSSDSTAEEVNYEKVAGGRSRFSLTLNGTVREEEGEIAEKFATIAINIGNAFLRSANDRWRCLPQQFVLLVSAEKDTCGLQIRHLLCQQTRHSLCQQTRHLWSPKAFPRHWLQGDLLGDHRCPIL